MKSKKQNWNPKLILNRFWILSVSLVITTGTAISPALPAMQRAFSNYSPTLINMVATIQQIPAFVILLFSSNLSERFGIKKIISIGLIIMGIMGILPIILNNIWLIILSRIGFGVGIGLSNSLAITLVKLYYSGPDKAQMLGNRSAFEPIGICIINLLVGILLNIGWKYSFLAYALIILVFIGFIKNVPEYKTINSNNIIDNKVNWSVIFASVFCGLMTIGMGIVNVLTPSILVAKHLGTPTEASWIITIYTVASMLAGFTFGTIFKKIHKYVLTTGLLCMSIGSIILNYANNISTIIISVIIIGIAYPISGTYVFNEIDHYTPSKNSAFSNSLLLVGCNLGTAITPIVISILNSISPLHGTNPGIGLYGILMFINMVIIIVFGLSKIDHQSQY